jgi:hypothetical protein
MALSNFNHDMEIISKLSDTPNVDDGLTAAQLKDQFDEGGKAIKKYINDILLPELVKEFLSKFGGTMTGSLKIIGDDGGTITLTRTVDGEAAGCAVYVATSGFPTVANTKLENGTYVNYLQLREASTYFHKPVALVGGGTGANNAAEARKNLGITPANIGAAAASHTHTPASIGAAAESHTHSASAITGTSTTLGAFTARRIYISSSSPSSSSGSVGDLWVKY